MRALFIINPAAGAGRAGAMWPRLKTRLPWAQLQADQVLTRGPHEAGRLARENATRYELVAAVGGDGTVREVADGILSTPESRTRLGILPLGTGNDVAEALGIASEQEAIRSISSSETRSIDAIRIGCQGENGPIECHALLFAGAGIIAEVLKRTTAHSKRWFGRRLAYPAGLIQALWSYRSPRMRVTWDREELEQEFLFVGASNTEIAGGGMRIAPGARFDDGLLNLNLVDAMGRWTALRQLRRLCRGQHVRHPKVRYLTARSLAIEAESPLEIAVDGDLVGHTPARIAVRPKALRVAVPQAS